MGSGSGPHPFGRWNYTVRYHVSTYNDHFTGTQNRFVPTKAHRSNQGYTNSIMRFPQGSFCSCRYPTGYQASRPKGLNNWHTRLSEFPDKEGPCVTDHQEVEQSTGRTQKQLDQIRPPIDPMRAKFVEADKKMAKQNVQPDFIPKDIHRHHMTKLRPGEIYRPSRKLGATGGVWSMRTRGFIEPGKLPAADLQLNYEANYDIRQPKDGGWKDGHVCY